MFRRSGDDEEEEPDLGERGERERPCASANSLAMTLAIVSAGLKERRRYLRRLPMTIVTAIVSPSARPRPRMIAPKMPERARGKNDVRIVSQAVAPRASAPSRSALGTARSTSRAD